MAEQSNDFNKEYLEEKIQAIGDKLGDAYGQPLMEELIIRMERTVSHFNDEVDSMIDLLKRRTKNQRNLLASMRGEDPNACLLYTSPSPRDATLSRMPSSA